MDKNRLNIAEIWILDKLKYIIQELKALEKAINKLTFAQDIFSEQEPDIFKQNIDPLCEAIFRISNILSFKQRMNDYSNNSQSKKVDDILVKDYYSFMDTKNIQNNLIFKTMLLIRDGGIPDGSPLDQSSIVSISEKSFLGLNKKQIKQKIEKQPDFLWDIWKQDRKLQSVQFFNKYISEAKNFMKWVEITLGKIEKPEPVKTIKYNGLDIVLHELKSINPKDIDFMMVGIKHCIDKLKSEGFGKLFSSTSIHIAPDKTFKKLCGRDCERAYAFYTISKSIIVMPYVNKNSKWMILSLFHEFGHHVHLSLKKQNVYQDWLDIYDNIKHDKSLMPSDYSGEDEKELFAEIFAYVMMPNAGHRKIHPELFQAFRNVIRGMHGISFRERTRGYKRYFQEFEIDLDKGDIILSGKFKNRPLEVTGFSTDEKGQPVVSTNKKDIPMLKFRIKKLMPEEIQVINKQKIKGLLNGIIKLNFDPLSYKSNEKDLLIEAIANTYFQGNKEEVFKNAYTYDKGKYYLPIFDNNNILIYVIKLKKEIKSIIETFEIDSSEESQDLFSDVTNDLSNYLIDSSDEEDLDINCIEIMFSLIDGQYIDRVKLKDSNDLMKKLVWLVNKLCRKGILYCMNPVKEKSTKFNARGYWYMKILKNFTNKIYNYEFEGNQIIFFEK